MTRDPVNMRRRLRAELKRLRAVRNLTQRGVADSLDWSTSKILRIENGTIAISVTDLRALLQLYDVNDEALVLELVEMARGSKRQPFSSYRGIFSSETLRYFSYESSATIIRQVEPLVIPGLLQTEEYARALLTQYRIDTKRVEQIWESRLERQEIFDRSDRPMFFFIIDESVVRRAVGGQTTMRHQLSHLLRMNSQAGVSIQILPFRVGANDALRGPFVYLEFGEPESTDVLYLESPLGDAVSRDEPEVTIPYLESFWRLEAQADPADALEQILNNLMP